MAQKSINDITIITGATVRTGDYKETLDKNGKPKFTREVQRKTAYIQAPQAELDKLQSIGMTIYTPRTKDENGQQLPFAMAPFAGKSWFYYNDIKTKQKVELDKSVPNFEVENAQIAISKNVSETGQVYFRVSAVRVQTKDNVVFFENPIFDDDDDFTQVSIETTEQGLLSNQDAF